MFGTANIHLANYWSIDWLSDLFSVCSNDNPHSTTFISTESTDSFWCPRLGRTNLTTWVVKDYQFREFFLSIDRLNCWMLQNALPEHTNPWVLKGYWLVETTFFSINESYEQKNSIFLWYRMWLWLQNNHNAVTRFISQPLHKRSLGFMNRFSIYTQYYHSGKILMLWLKHCH